MKSLAGLGVLFVIGIAVLGAWLGAFCVNYVLSVVAHHTIPFIWAFLLSIVTGDLTIPAAIVVKVLVLLGVLHG